MTSGIVQRWWLQPSSRWAVLLAVPLLLNLLLYAGLVRPLHAQISASRQARLLSTLKPVLESTVEKSARMLTAWRLTSFSPTDPSAVMQTVQQLANTHGVQIAALNSETRTEAGATTMPLDLQVSGRFSRLAHWMGDLETRLGFRIESWALSSGHGPHEPQQLAVKLTAFLRGAPEIRLAADAAASERTVEQLAQAVTTSQGLIESIAPYDAVFRRNPMQPLVDGQGQWISGSGFSNGLSVQGIIWSDQQPFAIVDDTLYAPGAHVGPYTIVEIKEQGIVVERTGVRLFVPMDRGLEQPTP